MIESIQNTKVKRAKSLQSRRERVREGRLFVEGVRLVGDALESGYEPDLLFYTESALSSESAREWVQRYQTAAWQVTDAVMSDMTDTVTPQGIAAIVPQPRIRWPEAPTLLVVADGVRDPGNLGTLIRSAAAAGVEGLIAPRGTVDPWSPKVLRSAMGSHFRLPILEGLDWPAVEAALTGLTVRLAEASGVTSYDEADWTIPSALIVGGEATGAGERAHARADAFVMIPMHPGVESLNASVAGSVILFEAARQRRQGNKQN